MFVRFLSPNMKDNSYVIVNGWGKCDITNAVKNVIPSNDPRSETEYLQCTESYC